MTFLPFCAPIDDVFFQQKMGCGTPSWTLGTMTRSAWWASWVAMMMQESVPARVSITRFIHGVVRIQYISPNTYLGWKRSSNLNWTPELRSLQFMIPTSTQQPCFRFCVLRLVSSRHLPPGALMPGKPLNSWGANRFFLCLPKQHFNWSANAGIIN